MGLIITPNTPGITYPNISDVANVVTINPSVDTTITSNTVTIEAASTLTIGSPGSGTLNINDFGDVILNNSDTYLKNAAVFIGNSSGKVGFFSDTNSAVQQAAIADSNPATAHDVVNSVLTVLRTYGLIAT